MIDKKTLLILLSLGIVFRVYFSYAIPPFTGNDEPAHLRYAQHILIEKKLPNANLYTDENLAGNEYFQPPLYYIIGSIFIFLSHSPTGQLQTLRVLSILLWLVAFYLSYKIVVFLKFPKWISLSALAFVALLPTYIVNSSTVTNDALVVPLTFTTFLYLLISSKKITPKNLVLLAFLTALTIITKISGLILIPTVLVLIYLYKRASLPKRIFLASIYCFLTFVLSFWWFLYNYLTYKSFLGPIETSTATFPTISFNFYKIFLIIRGTFATFWVAYGPANEIRLPINVYLILFFLTIYALLGNVLYLKKAISKKAKIIIENKPALILSIALIANIALFLIFNINQHQPLGRYLYPSLIQISAIFSTGLYFLTPKVARRFVPSFIILGLLTLNIWGAITLSNFYH